MGGGGAAVSPEAAAAGLLARFEALGPASSGCFEIWDGRDHPFLAVACPLALDPPPA